MELSFDPKHPLQSKTLWGVVLLLASGPLSRYFPHLGADDLREIVDNVATLIGALLAIWGRLSAQRPISTKAPSPLTFTALAAALILTGCATTPQQAQQWRAFSRSAALLTTEAALGIARDYAEQQLGVEPTTEGYAK